MSKKDKAAKGGDESGFAKPSEAPAGGDGYTLTTEENLGKLFLFTPLRVDSMEDKFKPGERKEIIVADVVEINEKKPEKSEEHSDVWIFAGYLRGALRGYVGERKVLGRLAQGKPDRGNLPWILEDATKGDEALAVAYLESLDPFEQKGAKAKADKKGKSAPAPEPESKKKSKKK